jgi:predicted cupin superfamily sugar epimerase
MITSGQLQSITLGNDILNGEVPQFVVPAQTWFAAKIKTATRYSLVSCTVAPGFDFSDFELAERENLIKEFPELEEVIREFSID